MPKKEKTPQADLRFDGKVAVVTGAGGGLGRCYALLLGSRGAKVVVNDFGVTTTGETTKDRPADLVVKEIKATGGEAVANYDSVEFGDKIVQQAIDTWGRIDILINNAGILRDTSFAKMSDMDWDLIYKVHMLGAYKTTKAAWPFMQKQSYGRIIMTSSSSGIYGNFGQANYSAQKMGLVGFGYTLAKEGSKKNIYTNIIAPAAGSRMLATVLPPDLVEALKMEYVAPVVGYLCHDSCTDNGQVVESAGGWIAKCRIQRTVGVSLNLNEPITLEKVSQVWGDVSDWSRTEIPTEYGKKLPPHFENVARYAPAKM
jgi:NAD(P)-dependent dehydrogenase (short-subunit alcohol dehydrogenase family)